MSLSSSPYPSLRACGGELGRGSGRSEGGSRNWPPAPAIASEQLIGLGRSLATGFVDRKPTRSGIAPRIKERLHCPPPRLNRNIVGTMLDLMPSPRLIFHEWDQHGTCSGLSPRAYFDGVRKARAAVKIPPEYVELERSISVTPGEVTEAFLKANPGLSPRAISVG